MGLSSSGFQKGPGWQRDEVTLAGYTGLHSSQAVFNTYIEYCSHRDDGWPHFYKSTVNSPDETAPETLSEHRRNCHLHYLWNSNLKAAASLKLHFFSHGREDAFHAHRACPAKSQTGPALSLNLIRMHASATLCPALTETGREMNTVCWNGKRAPFWSRCPCLQSSLRVHTHGIYVLAPPDCAGSRSWRALSTMLALLLPLVTNGFHSH